MCLFLQSSIFKVVYLLSLTFWCAVYPRVLMYVAPNSVRAPSCGKDMLKRVFSAWYKGVRTEHFPFF